MAFARGTWTGRAISAALAAQAPAAQPPAINAEAAKKAAEAAQKALVATSSPKTQNSAS